MADSPQAFYNSFISPLRKVPGPWWASISHLPKKYAILSKQQVHFHHKLHRKYGQFVRVGPNEIIVSDIDAFREIHRMGTGFVKSDFYKTLNPSEPGQAPFNLFAQTDPAEHAKRRKLLARGFTQAFLRSNWETVVQSQAQEAVNRIRTESQLHEEVDILKWWMFMAADIVSLLMFGQSSGLLKSGRVSCYCSQLVIHKLTRCRNRPGWKR